MSSCTQSRPSPVEARTRLAELIGECVFQALGLRESLKNERAALETQDTDSLHNAVSTKSTIVQSLSLLESERMKLCEAAGFAAGTGQMDQMTDWCDEQSVVRNGWTHLMDIVSECNALNLTNGAIIHARQQMVESNLGVLRGAEPDPDTYHREGRDNAAMNQRSLAQA